MDILEQYFNLLKQLNQYERRPAQERMVSEVSRGLADGRTLVVEAGTGSGKSFGYLIPLLFQNRRGADAEKKPVVVSTATIALQEQLMEKDIPFLTSAAGLEKLNAPARSCTRATAPTPRPAARAPRFRKQRR